jgi:hypothetical protein
MACSAFIVWVFHRARDIERMVEGMVRAKLHDATPFFPLTSSRRRLCGVAWEEENRIQPTFRTEVLILANSHL